MQRNFLHSAPATSFVRLSADRMSATYCGTGRHATDVGAVRAERPLDLGGSRSIAYFEATVVAVGPDEAEHLTESADNEGAASRPRQCSAAIGLARETFSFCRLPGAEAHSYGYHGSSGNKYVFGSGRSSQYGDSFGKDDVVGCGLLCQERQLFFTKNGEFLGYAGSLSLSSVSQPLYPVVAMHSPNETMQMNFGDDLADRPFAFDLAAYERKARDKYFRSALAKASVDHGAAMTMVRDHLALAGMQSRLEQFDQVLLGELGAPPSAVQRAVAESCAVRSRLIQLVESGLDGGSEVPADGHDHEPLGSRWIDKFRALLPALFEEESAASVADPRRVARCTALLLLQAVRFVHVLESRGAGAAALFAQTHLKPPPAMSCPPAVSKLLGLLAYAEPRQSPLAHLLGAAHRRFLAALFNKQVVCFLHGPDIPFTLADLIDAVPADDAFWLFAQQHRAPSTETTAPSG